MTVKRFSWLLVLALAQAAFAEQDGNGALKSPPDWPASGAIPATLHDQYVFVDRRAGQMVLAYPENLGQPEFKQSPGPLHIERFDLNNQVGASFSVAVQVGEKSLTYSYRVANSRNARQAIRSFNIPATQVRNEDSMFAPEHWNKAASPSQIDAMRLAIGSPSGVFLSWYSLDWNKSVIAPGTELGGFRVISTLRPGFVVAYAQGGGFSPNLRDDMPAAVLEQSVIVLRKEFNSQQVLTIGPKFAADTPAAEIARDFQIGIGKLIERKQLKGSSPAIREALQALQPYSETYQPSLVLRAKPQPGLETDVINALKVSLTADIPRSARQALFTSPWAFERSVRINIPPSRISDLESGT
jgi:hypothetical protein